MERRSKGRRLRRSLLSQARNLEVGEMAEVRVHPRTTHQQTQQKSLMSLASTPQKSAACSEGEQEGDQIVPKAAWVA